MHDEREWTPVELPWDDDEDDEELAWDTTGWEMEPIFDPLSRRFPPLPPEDLARLMQQGEPRVARRDDRARPKRKKESPQLTKRKRKRQRAWEIEDDE